MIHKVLNIGNDLITEINLAAVKEPYENLLKIKPRDKYEPLKNAPKGLEEDNKLKEMEKLIVSVLQRAQRRPYTTCSHWIHSFIHSICNLPEKMRIICKR